MNILTEVIEQESIDEIFYSPQDYVDNSYDRPLIKIFSDGNELFTVLIGIDDYGKAYLVAEDENTSEDFYPNENENLWDVYVRLVDDWTKER